MDGAWAGKRTKVLMTEYVICVSRCSGNFLSKLDENFSDVRRRCCMLHGASGTQETGEVLGKCSGLLTWLDGTSANTYPQYMALLAVVKNPKTIQDCWVY